MKPKDIFKDKPFPKWLVNHPIFKDVDKISKVFPGIGLPNCEDVCAIDNGDVATKSARILLDRVKNSLGQNKLALKDYKKGNKLTPDRIVKLERCKDLVSQIKKKIGKGKAAFITDNNGRVSLAMPDDITIEGDAKPFIRKGESFFRVYNKINTMLGEGRFTTMAKLDDVPAFKKFSTDNVPKNNFKIVFSSDGSTGAWDIATMSMRGVESCQSWGGEYSKCLIGSVVDPFVGIIYLTSGAHTKYGSKMIKRCVVRFAVNEETKKPFLFLDVMYPNPDDAILRAFRDFLSKRLQNKIEVYTTKDYKAPVKAYMPLTPLRKKILAYDKHTEYRDETIASYQDSSIPNKIGRKSKDRQSYLYDKNSKKKEQKFIDSFSENVVAALEDIDVNMLPGYLQPAIKKLNKDHGKYSAPKTTMTNAAKSIAKEMIKSVDKSSFTNSNLYLRRLYYAYFNNKNKAIKAVKSKAAKNIKGGLGIKELKPAQFVSMMNTILPKIDASMKSDLGELLDKKKKVKPLPLP